METCDGKRGRRYKQTFSKNMSKKGEPAITCAAAAPFCCGAFRLAAERVCRPDCSTLRSLPLPYKMLGWVKEWQGQVAKWAKTIGPVGLGLHKFDQLAGWPPHSFIPLVPCLWACRDCKSDENWTCITFYPDLERFGMEGERYLCDQWGGKLLGQGRQTTHQRSQACALGPAGRHTACICAPGGLSVFPLLALLLHAYHTHSSLLMLMLMLPPLTPFPTAELEAETVELMRKRVYDMAGILGKTVKVSSAFGGHVSRQHC